MSNQDSLNKQHKEPLACVQSGAQPAKNDVDASTDRAVEATCTSIENMDTHDAAHCPCNSLENTEVEGVSCNDQDVTPWLSEALTLGNMGLWTILWNPQTQFGEMIANTTMLSLLGLDEHPSPHACFEHWFSRIYPDAVPTVMAAIEQMVATGQQQEIDYPWEHPKRGNIQVRCGGKMCTKKQDKASICFRGYHQDISEQFQALSAMRSANERVQLMFNSMPFGATLWDEGFRFVDCNMEILRLFGLQEKQEYLENFFAFSPKYQPCGTASISLSRRYFGRVLKEGSVRFEWLHQSLNQDPIPCEITLVRGQQDGRLVIIGYTRDLRQFKDMMKDLEDAQSKLRQTLKIVEKANQAKSNFLANMSHEIRTPMNAILGMSHLCQQHTKDPYILESMKKIQNASHTLLSIVNDVLDVSKVDAGKFELEYIPFNLMDVMSNICTLGMSLASDKNIEVLFYIDSNVPTICIGDGKRLGQVLTNLLSNAIKFTFDGSVVLRVVVLKQEGAVYTVSFEVKDSGIGMPAERIESIFKPFEQVDVSTTRKFGGTGLGLAICKHIIESMGSHIAVESEIGKGSTFRFSVPMVCVEDEQRAHSLKPLPQSMRALVLDDNPIACEIFQHLLTDMGFAADVAYNFDNASSMLQQADRQGAPYHVIIIDWNMPDVDGYKSARAIKKLDLSTRPVLLLTSAYGEVVADDIVAQEVFAAFIPKPVLPVDLQKTVRNALGIADPNEEHATASTKSDTVLQGLVGKHVLLVEDNDINQEVAVALLENLGVRATVANNGLEGFNLCKEQVFDAVLMDIQMPVMDGLTAARNIRTLPNCDKDSLPIIAMTAHAMQDHMEQSFAAGMNDHITKPIDPDVLAKTLVTWLISNQGNHAPVVHNEPEGKNLPIVEDANSEILQKDALKIQLPGIDAAKGLFNTGGDLEAYKDALYSFEERHNNTVELIKRYVQKNAWDDACRLIRALSAAADTLGMTDLVDLVGKVEQSCITKQLSEAVLQRLTMQLEHVYADISTFFSDTNGTMDNTLTTGTVKDKECVIETLQQALDMMDKDITMSMHHIKQLNMFVPSVLSGDLYMQAYNAVYDLDKAALAVVVSAYTEQTRA